jgi:alpha-galactosidase
MRAFEEILVVNHREDVRHLRANGVSIVVDEARPFLPAIVYWGADLGELTPGQVRGVVVASRRQPAISQSDVPVRLGVLPENAHSWTGTPGLSGARDGRAFSTRFEIDAIDATTDPDGTQRVTYSAADPAAALELVVVLELLASGLARMRATVTNRDRDSYALDGLTLAWPIPQQATEILDFTGRWARERVAQRHPLTHGTYLREGRRGRTGADATLLLLVGEAGFGFRHGEVWGVHTAWSGNHRTLVERTSATESILAGGELLLPGEVRLARDEHYTSPWVYAVHGSGLDELSGRIHGFLRARPHAPRLPRPVTGNCWEAVYFDHALAPLTELADAFAAVGIERFVLDDGWFRHRRNDHAGLGDWYVDETVWPDGLHPLIDHVRSLGMEFGLWVEPEMVNVDSDIARAHPEWILATGGRLPPEGRHQQVLNLADPDAFGYVAGRLHAILDEYDIFYLKWDHNRDLVEAGDQATGTAGVHRQTLAAYRLMDSLKAAHPRLEIESCSSGGARVDLEVLQHTDRVWASDCSDAHERQSIQRFTGLLVPPEMIGAHISADPNHQTGRRLSLAMRAVTAMFGDLGVEWNVAALDDARREELAGWISLYKRWRDVLHTGDVVNIDHPDPALRVHGVVSADRDRALFAGVLLQTSVYGPPGLVRLEGLDAGATYRVEPLEATRGLVEAGHFAVPEWWATGLTTAGGALARHGFQFPDVPPDTPVLFSVVRLDEGSAT